MGKKSVRIEVTNEQLANLRREVLCDPLLSSEKRRRAVRRFVTLPADGSRVDLYYEGNFVGTV